MSDPNERESIERQSFLELTRSMAGLPLDQAAAILETSASIAAISLRAGIEFLRAAPAAAHLLQPAELRAWGEMGRRLAMSDYETAISFFVAGVDELQSVPPELFPAIFTLCSRQMTLSTTIGRETLASIPQLVEDIGASDFKSASLLDRASVTQEGRDFKTGSIVEAVIEDSSSNEWWGGFVGGRSDPEGTRE